MNQVLDLIRPHPHRGDLIAAGAVPFALAILIADLRMNDDWGDGAHLLITALSAGFIFAMALLAPLEREEGPRGYHSVLLVTGLVLVLAAITRLAQVLGSAIAFESAGATTWQLTLFAAFALTGAVLKRSAICTLLGAIALGGAWLALFDTAFDLEGLTTFRWLLLGLVVIYALRSLGLREHHPRHAVALVNAAGVTAVAQGGLLVGEGMGALFFGFTAFGEVEVSSDLVPWGWQLVVAGCGMGLLAYAAAERESGPAYLGVIALLLFTFSAVYDAFEDPSLMGWPIVLFAMSLIGLGLGLRPRRELPPPPDHGAPRAETLPLPGAAPPDPDDL